MKVNTTMIKNPVTTTLRVISFMLLLAAVSCNRIGQHDVMPQSILDKNQYALEVSKTLYSSIKLSNYNYKEVKENFFKFTTDHENDIIRNTTKSIINNDRFNNLFTYKSAVNARVAASEVSGLNLENVKAEINSSGLTSKVRGKIIQLGNELTAVKARLNQNNITDPISVKNEVDRLVSSFESSIVNDSSISLDEKTKLFAVTIATRDNLDNVKQLISGTNSGGRKGCFFCNVVNIFVTIVVAAVIISVAAVVVVAAAAILAEGIVAAAIITTAAAFGASVGAVIGVAYTITDHCLDIVDYGQDVYGKQLDMVFAQC
ncbi:hypothetical protein GCM10027578_05580 [Spirosoma luteolum]